MGRGLSLLLALAAFAGYAIADTGPFLNPSLPIQFSASKNVGYVYHGKASGGSGVNDVFAIATKHRDGSKIYATTSGSTYIYMASGNPGTDLRPQDAPNPPANALDSSVSGGIGGWVQM